MAETIFVVIFGSVLVFASNHHILLNHFFPTDQFSDTLQCQFALEMLSVPTLIFKGTDNQPTSLLFMGHTALLHKKNRDILV